MAEIKLKNLTKRWGDFIGVDNFDPVLFNSI